MLFWLWFIVIMLISFCLDFWGTAIIVLSFFALVYFGAKYSDRVLEKLNKQLEEEEKKDKSKSDRDD